jgi:hypothetical protein
MAAILTINGLRVAIYMKDHGPAHVHVAGNGVEAVFKLNCPGGPPELRDSYGVPKKQLVRIRVALAGHLGLLCDAWRWIHGHF